jgi:hypothetical protein
VVRVIRRQHIDRGREASATACGLVRLLCVLAMFASATFVVPAPAAAQERTDSAAVLLEAARRFARQGRTDIADALYEMILERFGGTAAAEQVRQIRAAMPTERRVRTGAVELQVWGSLYGLWLGVAAPLIADADSPEAYGIGLLLGGPGGFFAARQYARSRSLSEGQARAITWGGTWGTWQGLGWALVFDAGKSVQRECPVTPNECFEYETGDDTQELIGAMVAGGLAGIATGAVLSRKTIPAGLATTVNFGSLWGTWFGFATSYIAGLRDDDLLAGTLIGGDAGLVATAVFGPGWQLSRNRARLISIGGVMGGLVGGGLDLLVQPDDEKVAVAIPLATSIAGLALGALTTRGNDRPDPSGRGGDAGAGALLRFDGGKFGLDAPLIVPTMQRDERYRSVWKPAVGLTLFSARF